MSDIDRVRESLVLAHEYAKELGAPEAYGLEVAIAILDDEVMPKETLSELASKAVRELLGLPFTIRDSSQI